MRVVNQIPVPPEVAHRQRCISEEAAAGAVRARILQEDARSVVLDAEDHLTTGRNRVGGLAAGIPQPVDADPRAVAEAQLSAPAPRRRPAYALLVAAVAGIAATAGTVVSLGVATPAPIDTTATARLQVTAAAPARKSAGAGDDDCRSRLFNQ